MGDRIPRTQRPNLLSLCSSDCRNSRIANRRHRLGFRTIFDQGARVMWQPGSPNYSDGSQSFSTARKNVVPPQKSSKAGTGNIVPYCESSAPPQADSQLTASPQYTENAITSLPLTISPLYKQKWLGNSTASLSDCDRTIISIILHSRTALQSGGFFVMAIAVLLVLGTAIFMGSPKVLRSENLHPVVQSRALP